MLTLILNGKEIPIYMNAEECAERVGRSSALIKTMTGIGNNAAWACCLDALDHVRQHPAYRHNVKRAFSETVRMFHEHEHRLIYAENLRLFHLADMTPETRKRYGNISDREYFDFWASSGATAYARNRQWATSLHNKFRLSLVNHSVPHPELVAWPMTAAASLKLAEVIYENSCQVCQQDYHLPKALLDAMFGQLSLKQVASSWDRAVALLEPWTGVYDLTPTEQKNIQNGLDQLQEEWLKTDTITDALVQSVQAYDEVFRTQGEQKKAIKQLINAAT